VILPIYLDSPLAPYLGVYGYSLAPAVSVVTLIAYVLLGRWKNVPGKMVGKVSREIWLLAIYLVAMNFIGLLYWSLTGGAEHLYGVEIYQKAIRGCIIVASSACYLTLLDRLRLGIDEERVIRPFVIAFGILCIVAVVEYVQMPYALAGVHFSGTMPYWRPRLLCTESSQTALQIIVYGGSSLYYFVAPWKNKSLFLFTAVAILLLIITTGSKSLQVAMLIGTVIGMAYALRRDARWVLALMLVVLLLIVNPWLVEDIANGFANDIENFTSVATRTYTMIVALLVAITHPLGVGNALYLYYYPQALMENLRFISDGFNVGEILTYVNGSTDYALAAKSALFQYGLYGGLIGMGLLLVMMFQAIKALRMITKSNILTVVGLLACFAVALWDSFDTQYCFWAFIGLANYYELTAGKYSGEVWSHKVVVQ
jgi:hypothetical protein